MHNSCSVQCVGGCHRAAEADLKVASCPKHRTDAICAVLAPCCGIVRFGPKSRLEAPELLFSETFVDVFFFAQEQLPFDPSGEETRK